MPRDCAARWSRRNREPSRRCGPSGYGSVTPTDAAAHEDELVHRARAGDTNAFAAIAERFRPELQLHCYRIVGSVQDAEDLVQETLLAAWRGLGEFGERASIRTWLYRIATNRSID